MREGSMATGWNSQLALSRPLEGQTYRWLKMVTKNVMSEQCHFFAKNIEYLCIAALYEELYEARKDL